MNLNESVSRPWTAVSEDLPQREMDAGQSGLSPVFPPKYDPDQILQRLANNKDESAIHVTAYDTAWLASIPAKDAPKQPMFPDAVRWLIDNQHADGSWGGKVRYIHDRILCTLAALVPLVEYGTTEEEKHCIQKGTRFLWQNGHFLANEPIEMVAFELLLPSMVQRAQKVGISVPPHLDIYATQRAEKMRLIPPGALYSPRVTIVHSLEFLGEQASISGLHAAQGANGAIGNSPAATAFYYIISEDPKALAYLQECQAKFKGSQVPVLYPCETYELLWSAYHLYLAGIPAEKLLTEQHIKLLHNSIENGGVSLSPSFPIPDADDTAVALILLQELGYDMDPKVLQYFESAEGHFASFQYERHSSVGVSLHVLHALLRVPGYPNLRKTIFRLLDYLASQQQDGLYWLDKWHISPFYATAHALCVLKELPEVYASRMTPLIEQSRQWLRWTQNPDGSWGYYSYSSIEETAYGLLALASGRIGPLSNEDIEACQKAVQYLRENAFDENGNHRTELHYPLWIDKCLYTPSLVVQGVIDGALQAYGSLVEELELEAD